MNLQEQYEQWFRKLSADLVLSPDLRDETVETTLKALWHTAAGKPCSAARACATSLEDLNNEQTATLAKMVGTRLQGTPLMQITGRVEFMGLELLFEPSVCLVRRETEILARRALELLSVSSQGQPTQTMVDVGCGSGNLSCGIAQGIPGLRVHAIDILPACVELTRRNLHRCGLADRGKVAQGDLFGPLEGLALENSVDMVVCNPPYISSPRLESDRSHLVAHEPREALDGGPYGFAVHQRLIKQAPTYLRPGGWLLFEFGAGQRRQIQSLFSRTKAFDQVEFASDADGIERVGIARRSSV